MQEQASPDSWWRHGVIYQIYPRSYQDSNDDGIGDLRGIINRLEYLNDGRGASGASLGIDAIWLSPVYPSPQRDFGYDISDYDGIDPVFGSLADFDELLSEAHRRGIRIIMDLVVNHSSDQHAWFRESRSSRDNAKRDWYIWHPGKPGRRPKPPNNWFAGFELKSAWWWDEASGEFYLGTFTRHQPELNWRNLELRAAIYAMMRRWLDRGVDGFRLDVVNWYIKDADWRSNPWRLSLVPPDLQNHVYDRNQAESHEICREMRQVVAAYPGRMLVGEVFTDQASRAASYYGRTGDELHFAFNFSFLFSPWKAKAFYRRIEEWAGLLPPDSWPNQTLSNHDQRRHASRYATVSPAVSEARARVAVALLLLQRGTPFLYYGEEIGMRSLPLRRKDIQDPMGKILWPLLRGRDWARTPMQWDARGPELSWLPVNPDHGERNVARQQADPASLWHFYRCLLALRKKEPALHAGDQEWLVRGEGGVLAFVRCDPASGRRLVVCLNFGRLRRACSKLVGGVVLMGSHRHAGTVLSAPVALHAHEVLVSEIPQFPRSEP